MNTQKPVKPMVTTAANVRYMGTEPDWPQQPEDKNRVSRLSGAFAWYGYHFGHKEAKECVLDWLARNSTSDVVKEFARVPENSVINTLGWLCRMGLRGLVFNERESNYVRDTVANLIERNQQAKVEVDTDEPAAPKPNIQERLREKVQAAAAEIDAMYDDFRVSGCKLGDEHKPMNVIRAANVVPQMVSDISDIWQRHLDELLLVAAGTDGQLVEGYSHLSAKQLKACIRFCEQVIDDCASYRQIKKVERKPRKKKPVSPEKLTARFKYLREYAELKLTSEPVTKLVNASEAWFYEVKKRKLIHVVADPHVRTFSVKGSALIGIDDKNTVMKTLRKPEEQIKKFMAGGLPQMRKFFKDIKATEARYNGRGTENLVLLKIK